VTILKILSLIKLGVLVIISAAVPGPWLEQNP